MASVKASRSGFCLSLSFRPLVTYSISIYFSSVWSNRVNVFCYLSIIICCCLICVSSNSILILLLDCGLTWSRCAFDKKPKIPIDVIKIKTTTAPVKYAFIVLGTNALRQLLYNQLAATSLPTSNALPIAIIGKVAPANKVAKPIILYPAAMADIEMADIKVIIIANILLSYIIKYILFSNFFDNSFYLRKVIYI